MIPSNELQKQIQKTISTSINNSPTDGDYMREVADAIYAILKMDLFKLQNAIQMELTKHKVR